MNETLVKVVRRVTWIGNDGGHKVGDQLDFQHGSKTQVRSLKSGEVLFVPTELLKPYPAEPIEEPAAR